MAEPAAQEALTNKLTGTAVAVGGVIPLADLNVYLETATLTVGLLAGLFALFFHIRRWYRDKYLYRPTVEDSEDK